MVREMSNNAGNAKSVKLNLDALGDAANDTVNFGTNEKPELKEPVQAKIVNIDFRRRNELLSNQGDPAKKYYKCVLSVETEFEFYDEESKQTKTAHCRDNYSGLRYIPKLVVDENNEVVLNAHGEPEIVLDATGEPVLERLWLGDGSDFGQLFLKAQEYDSSIRSYSDFLSFMEKHEDCMIMTEHPEFNRKTFVKEVIQEFI